MPVLTRKYDSPSLDGRVKILPSQHEEVRARYLSLKSMRKVAALYGVDKRLIQFIVYPERLKAFQAERRAAKSHRLYYDKDNWKLTMRKYRAKKKRLGYSGRDSVPSPAASLVKSLV